MYFFSCRLFFRFVSCNPFLDFAYFIEFSSLGWFFCDLCLVSLFCKFVSNSSHWNIFAVYLREHRTYKFKSKVHTKILIPFYVSSGRKMVIAVYKIFWNFMIWKAQFAVRLAESHRSGPYLYYVSKRTGWVHKITNFADVQY